VLPAHPQQVKPDQKRLHPAESAYGVASLAIRFDLTFQVLNGLAAGGDPGQIAANLSIGHRGPLQFAFLFLERAKDASPRSEPA